MLEICKKDSANVAVKVWQDYYTAVGDESRGLLPFRVWQIYQTMVDYVKHGQVAEFVCAAGILSHYVGDACQPLHISYMFDGDPDDSVPTQVKDEKTGQLVTQNLPRAKGVHAAYEDDMVNYHAEEIKLGIDKALVGGSITPPPPLIHGGESAAKAVVELIEYTFDKITPTAIVTEFNAASKNSNSKRQIADDLWSKFGSATIEVMARGSQYLAMLWGSAWQEGNGAATIHSLGQIDQSNLIKLYDTRSFLTSYTLDKIGPVLH